MDQRDYPMAPAVRARLMGLGLVGLGALLLVVTLLVATGLSAAVLSIAAILVVAGVFGLGHLLVRRWVVLHLDEHGYVVRFVRGAGAHSARWTEVLDLATSTVAGARCVVLRLRDGRTTTVPVDVVEGDPDELVRELARRLEDGNTARR